MKRWMWGLWALLAILGLVSIFGGLGLAIDHTWRYINASPVRRDGANAFVRMTGYLFVGLVVTMATLKTLWTITKSSWQAYQPRWPRRPGNKLRLNQPG